MLLQPGTQRVSTAGSLSATQSASTEVGIVSLPPISSFTVRLSQSEQLCGQTAVDAGSLAVGERGFLHDLERGQISDREWHVRSHHDAVGADDIGEITQRARVLDNRVVIHRS